MGHLSESGFRIGEWIISPQRGVVFRDQHEVRIRPLAMAVLQQLAQAGGEVVTRNQLTDALWPGARVADEALTQCVVELRKAFGDSARNARIIETIPRIGFRLVPPVEPAGTHELQEPRSRWRRILWPG